MLCTSQAQVILGCWVRGSPPASRFHLPRPGIPTCTNYAGRRLERLLSFLPEKQVRAVSTAAERQALAGAARFYKMARLLFAPNQELVDLLEQQTAKPCFLMQRGVDAELYTPAKRDPGEHPFTIGY